MQTNKNCQGRRTNEPTVLNLEDRSDMAGINTNI